MTQLGSDNYQNPNRINGSVPINAGYEQPENILILDGKTHVTARWLAARFKITHALILHVIDEIEQDSPTGESSIVWSDQHHCWVDSTAFNLLCGHPQLANSFSPALKKSVGDLLKTPKSGGRVTA
ncbi:MAG: hypothetical protein BWK73_37855 [Thiothrix lacustris]|uniref:Uncharacterized protein n=1 Tax=Thiothrix lacustris TaxID=525917 RepID=A0A1Y1QEU0_9GAMM|nr:MAG: hypothetical protein BWK73_37855 [Thiothrix lacustris]